MSTTSLDPMLSYFLSLLDVRFRRITPTITPGSDPVKDDTLKEISRVLAEFQTTFREPGHEDDPWNQAYRLERLFVLIEPPDHLWLELKRRLAEAAEENVGSAARLASAAETLAPQVLDPKTPQGLLPGGDAAVRSLLLEILEDTHWTIQRKFYSRPIRKKATARIVWFGMGAFSLFMLPYLALYYNLSRADPVYSSSWAWLPIYSVATTGLFGALFSRLLYLQSNWDALTIGGLKDAREYASITLRGCVGMIGAVIVFFFLKSGVIGGGLFPDFSQIGIEEFTFPDKLAAGQVPHSFRLYYPSKAWALLVVWSFLAGFSERLVSSILRDTETTISKFPTQK
jgi:hypothetical protein